MALYPKSWPQQFTPFSPVRKSIDSCVIASAIPKSGTYLLKSIVNYLGKWENIGVQVNTVHWDNHEAGDGWVDRACLQRYSVKKLRNGQLVSSHLLWSKAIERAVAQVTPQRRIKLLFMCRDPRDIMLSNLRYEIYPEMYPGSLTPQRENQFLQNNFSDDDNRLSYLLEQEQPLIRSYMRWHPWLQSPHCYAIKFEDLYPDVVGLRDNVLGDALTGLLAYLEIDPKKIDPLDLYDKVYGKSLTASTDEAKVGRFRSVFKDHHYKLIDNPDYRYVLDAFGYEW